MERTLECAARRFNCSSRNPNLEIAENNAEAGLQKPSLTTRPCQLEEDERNASKGSCRVPKTTGYHNNALPELSTSKMENLKTGTLEMRISGMFVSPVRKSIDGDTGQKFHGEALTSTREVDKAPDDSVFAASEGICNSNAYSLSSSAIRVKRNLLAEPCIACSKRRRVGLTEKASRGNQTCSCKISLEGGICGSTIHEHWDEAAFLEDKSEPNKSIAVANKDLNFSCSKEGGENLANTESILQEERARLVKRQEEEIYEFHKNWEQKKVLLENDHKMESTRICSTYRHTIRTYKLNILDEKFARKMKEYEYQKDLCFKELKHSHLHESMEENENGSRLLAYEKLYTAVDREQNEMPLHISQDGNFSGCFKPGELGKNDGLKSSSSLSRDLMIKQNPHLIPSIPGSMLDGNVGRRIPRATPSANMNSESESKAGTVSLEKASLGRVEQPHRADYLVNISKGVIPMSACVPVKCSDDGIKARARPERTPNEELRVIDLMEDETPAPHEENNDRNVSDILHAAEYPKYVVCSSISTTLASLREKAPIAQPVVSLASGPLVPTAHRTGVSLMDGKNDRKEILGPLAKDLHFTCKGKQANSVNASFLKHAKEIFANMKRCAKERMENLLKNHQEEIQKFHKTWDQKRLALEKDHKKDSALICSTYRDTIRRDMLKVLDKEFAAKMKEYKCQKDLFLKDLEDYQLCERNEENEKTAHLLAESKFYASEDSSHSRLPLHGAQNGNEVGYFEVSELEVEEETDNVLLSRDLIKEASNYGFSCNPEIIPLGCTSAQSVDVSSDYDNIKKASVDRVEQPNRAENSIDIAVNLFSLIPYDPGKCMEDGIPTSVLADTILTKELVVDSPELETPVEESGNENDRGDGVGSGILNSLGSSAAGGSSSISMKLTYAGEKVPFFHPTVSLACDLFPLTPVLQGKHDQSLASKFCSEDAFSKCGISSHVQIPPVQAVVVRPVEKFHEGDQFLQPPEKAQPTPSRNEPSEISLSSLCTVNESMHVPPPNASEVPIGNSIHEMRKQFPEEDSEHVYACGDARAYFPEPENALKLTLELEYKVEETMTSEEAATARTSDAIRINGSSSDRFDENIVFKSPSPSSPKQIPTRVLSSIQTKEIPIELHETVPREELLGALNSVGIGTSGVDHSLTIKKGSPDTSGEANRIKGSCHYSSAENIVSTNPSFSFDRQNCDGVLSSETEVEGSRIRHEAIPTEEVVASIKSIRKADSDMPREGDAIGSNNVVVDENDGGHTSFNNHSPSMRLSDNLPSFPEVSSPLPNHIFLSSLVLQNVSPQLSTFTTAPDGHNQSSLEAVPHLKHLDAVQTEHTDHEDLLADLPNRQNFSLPTDQNQTDLLAFDGLTQEPGSLITLLHNRRTPFGENQPDLLATCGVDCQRSGEFSNPFRCPEPQIVHTTGTMPNQTLLQSRQNISLLQGLYNHYRAAPRISSLHSYTADPLQKELERIREETEQAVKIHEAKKLQMKSDRDKEIAQIMSKYEAKHHDEEAAFLLKKGELTEKHRKVIMNKKLAEAFRFSKLGPWLPGIIGIQQGASSTFMQQLCQLSSSAGQASPIAVSQPPLQNITQSTAFLSSSPTRNPNINLVNPSLEYLQVGSEIRAPAPHLHRFSRSQSFPIPLLHPFHAL